MTLPPRPGKRNERFRDLIDVLLMAPLVTDHAGLREACESVFRTRATHEWPPVLAVPAHWVNLSLRSLATSICRCATRMKQWSRCGRL
jgi:hypothetical protein